VKIWLVLWPRRDFGSAAAKPEIALDILSAVNGSTKVELGICVTCGSRAVPTVYVISVAPHDNFFLIPREDQFPDHLAYLLLAQVEAIELDYYNGISKYKSD